MSELVSMLKRHEGFRSKPYTDSVGVLTIGIGRNLDDVGISEDEAIYLLQRDIAAAQAALRRAYPWFDILLYTRQDALTDLCFNIGPARLKGFVKFLAAMEAHDYERAASEMLDSKWAAQVGTRAVELAEIIRTGNYVKEG